MDTDAQSKLEELIRLSNVESNRLLAMEETPEVFFRVHMLYVHAEVNGVKLKAFVDSGAQNTIMSKQCAEKCGLMRLLDTRFAGRVSMLFDLHRIEDIILLSFCCVVSVVLCCQCCFVLLAWRCAVGVVLCCARYWCARYYFKCVCVWFGRLLALVVRPLLVVFTLHN